MNLTDCEKENDFLRKQLDEANKTIDLLGHYQTEEKHKPQTFFNWILSLFEEERPFKGWDIGMEYISSTDGIYVLKINTTFSLLQNCRRSKSPFHSGERKEERKYFNFLKREILLRSKGK